MDLGIVAFWIFVAAVVVANIWRSKHSEAMKHETVRLLIEKGQKLDESQLLDLLNPKKPDWPMMQMMRPKPGRPGEIYRGLRFFGTILLFLSLGFVIVGIWRGMLLGMRDPSVLGIATTIPILATVGIGLFVASRYVSAPSKDESWKK
jgi:hypothetical protein